MILIYSDLLLDDLCGLDVLGKWCNERSEKAFVVGTCLDELSHSEYGSPKVRTLDDARGYLNKWFDNYELVPEGSGEIRRDPNVIIVLCPVTAFVADLDKKITNCPQGCSCYVMGGSGVAEDHMKGEYNASCDKESFSRLLQMGIAKYYTMEVGKELFRMLGYETEMFGKKPEFLDEYCAQMTTMKESLYCPDLMVANDLMIRQGKSAVSLV